MIMDRTRPSAKARSPSSGAWRLQLVACSAALAALAFRQSPGLIVPDTKLDLTANPVGFLHRALHLWEPDAAFGQLQNQAYGYLFPMGPFHVAGDIVGLPAWITQRAWWSLVLITAFLGMTRLASDLGIGTPRTRLVGGLVYALAPRILVSLGAISVEAWPTAMAPWVIIPVVRAWQGKPPVRQAALSALAVVCIGGVNAAATAAAVVPACLAVICLPDWAGRWRFAGWWCACTAAATVWWWWPLLLLGRHSPPFLDWIETASNTTQHTSLIEVLRGSDHWLSYLNGPAGPQWPAGWLLATEPILILDTVVVAALGVAGLAHRDLPQRRFLLTTAVVGLMVVSAGYVGAGGGPLAQQFRLLLDGPFAPFRNVHKFDVVIRVPLTLGIVHVLASMRRLPRSAWRWRPLAAGLAVVALIGMATPALAGRLAQDGGYERIPDYWRKTSAWLDDNVDTGRALLIPGSPFAEYLWGSPRDEPLQALGDAAWAVRDAVPLSSAGNIRLLDAIEARLAAGKGGLGVVEALRRAGVSHLVLRNDLNRARTEAPRPILVHQAITDLPGVRRVATFGPNVGTDDEPDTSMDSRLDVRYPAVEIYQIDDPEANDHRVQMYPLQDTIRMSGAAESLLTAGDAGLVHGHAVFLAGDGAAVADPRPVPVVTDGLRRRAVWFGATRDNATEVLSAHDPGPLGRAARDFLPVDDVDRETTAVANGVADVTASSSGSDPRATIARGAEHSPWAAVDGDVDTSWISGEYGQPVGQWIKVRFDWPRTVGSIELMTLNDDPISAPIQQVAVATDDGVVQTSLLPGASTHVVSVPTDRTAWITIRVVKIGAGTPSGVGIRELRIPGVTANRTLAVPSVQAGDMGGPQSAETLVFATAEGTRPQCVMTGQIARCARHLSRAGEEHSALRRRAAVTVGGTYTAMAVVRPRPGAKLEELITPAPGAAVADASSRAVADPLGRPQAAVDADSGTGWVAAEDDERPTLTLSWDDPRRIKGVHLTVEPWLAASRPSRLEIQAGGRRFTVDVNDRGNALLPRPVVASTLAIRILAVDPVVNTEPAFGLRTVLPAGISELQVLGASNLVAPIDESASVALPCGSGPPLVVDSASVPTTLSATIGDLLRGRRLQVRACASVSLTPGRHDIVLGSSRATRPESLTLQPTAVPAGETDRGDDVTVRSWKAATREVAVSERDAPAVLAITENVNSGWSATLGGTRLTPVRLDGWSQGFIVPAGPAGVVELTYGPDRPYRAALATGAVAIGAVAVVAWRGASPTTPRVSRHQTRHQARHRRRSAMPVITLGVGIMVVLGGLAGFGAALVAVAVVLVGPWYPAMRRMVPVLAAVAVVLAGLIVALRPWPSAYPGAHSGLAQLLALVGIAFPLIGPVQRRADGTSYAPADVAAQYVSLHDLLGTPLIMGHMDLPTHRKGSLGP
jgi:arabinofuranan 3-O-arabinosyltransferase